MRAYEKKNFYSELKAYFNMMQTEARSEFEYCIATRAALDPEDEDERHELTYRADRSYAEMLRHERSLMYIEELQNREESIER